MSFTKDQVAFLDTRIDETIALLPGRDGVWMGVWGLLTSARAVAPTQGYEWNRKVNLCREACEAALTNSSTAAAILASGGADTYALLRDQFAALSAKLSPAVARVMGAK